MTSKEYGLINGFGFSFTFSVFGVIAGFVVDHKSINDRVTTILGISAMLCGIISLLYSLCSHFYQVVILRAMLGAIQAFGAPASVCLITSHFRSASERPLANASYTVGLYVGSGLASLSTIFAEKFGWKLAFEFVGVFALMTSFAFEATVDLQFTFLDWVKGNNRSDKVDSQTEEEGVFTNTEKSPLLPTSTGTGSGGGSMPKYASSGERLQDVAIEDAKDSESSKPLSNYKLWSSSASASAPHTQGDVIGDTASDISYAESKQVEIVAGEYFIDESSIRRQRASNQGTRATAAFDQAAAGSPGLSGPDVAAVGISHGVAEVEGFLSMIFTIFFGGKIKGTLPLLFLASGVRYVSAYM
jgi:hypothetical protein